MLYFMQAAVLIRWRIYLMQRYAFAVYTRKKVSVTDLRWRFGIMSKPSLLNVIGWYKLYSHAYCIVVRSEFAYIVNNSEAIK